MQLTCCVCLGVEKVCRKVGVGHLFRLIFSVWCVMLAAATEYKVRMILFLFSLKTVLFGIIPIPQIKWRSWKKKKKREKKNVDEPQWQAENIEAMRLLHSTR